MCVSANVSLYLCVSGYVSVFLLCVCVYVSMCLYLSEGVQVCLCARVFFFVDVVSVGRCARTTHLDIALTFGSNGGLTVSAGRF